MADDSVQNLCSAALRKLRVYDAGDTPDIQDVADTFAELKRMLHAWAATGLYVYVSSEDTHTLSAGTASYTIGSGGDINSARPLVVNKGSFVRANGHDTPLDIIGEERYNRYSQKDVGSDYPAAIWYKPSYPLGTIYLWPPGGGVLHLWSEKRLSEPSTLNSNMVVPEEYQDAIVWNLAKRMSPEFAGDPTAYIVAQAIAAKKIIENINAANDPAEMEMELRLLNRNNNNYDIDGG